MYKKKTWHGIWILERIHYVMTKMYWSMYTLKSCLSYLSLFIIEPREKYIINRHLASVPRALCPARSAPVPVRKGLGARVLFIPRNKSEIKTHVQWPSSWWSPWWRAHHPPPWPHPCCHLPARRTGRGAAAAAALWAGAASRCPGWCSELPSSAVCSGSGIWWRSAAWFWSAAGRRRWRRAPSPPGCWRRVADGASPAHSEPLVPQPPVKRDRARSETDALCLLGALSQGRNKWNRSPGACVHCVWINVALW